MFYITLMVAFIVTEVEPLKYVVPVIPITPLTPEEETKFKNIHSYENQFEYLKSLEKKTGLSYVAPAPFLTPEEKSKFFSLTSNLARHDYLKTLEKKTGQSYSNYYPLLNETILSKPQKPFDDSSSFFSNFAFITMIGLLIVFAITMVFLPIKALANWCDFSNMPWFGKAIFVFGILALLLVLLPIIVPLICITLLHFLRHLDAFLRGPSYIDSEGKGYHRVNNPYEND